jgi:hypothetical protein
MATTLAVTRKCRDGEAGDCLVHADTLYLGSVEKRIDALFDDDGIDRQLCRQTHSCLKDDQRRSEAPGRRFDLVRQRRGIVFA